MAHPTSELRARLAKDLNERQQEAVFHPAGPLLVLAGAGSGKTRVLTYRLAYLIESGQVRPHQCTGHHLHQQGRRRDEGAGGPPAGRRRPAGSGSRTFHPSCARMLRQDAPLLGYKTNFTIYDEDDSTRLITPLPGGSAARRQALPAQGPPEPHLRRQEQAHRRGRLRRGAEAARAAPPGTTKAAPTRTSASTTSPPRSTSATRPACSRRTPSTSTTCSCARSTSCSSSPSGSAYYRDLFRHVLVDEYQDTNRAQYMLVKLLTEEHRQVTVVGDDDQSVYSWRGADIRNILSFEDDFPDATVVKLEQNYRSTTTILDAANALVAHNRGRKPKNLWSDRGAGEPVTVFECRDEHEEARLVCDEIVRLLKTRPGFRPGRLLPGERPVPGARGHAGAPGHRLPGHRRHQVLPAGGDQGPAGLSARDAQRHRTTSRCSGSSTRRGAGWATWPSAGCRSTRRRTGCRLREALCCTPRRPGLDRRRGQRLPAAGRGLRLLGGGRRARVARRPVRTGAARRAGCVAALKAERTLEAEGRLENLEEFVGVAEEFDRLNPEGTLADFLQEISLYADIDSLEESEPLVTLMTLHNAKGLEFPVVFITGMEEGLFPHSRSLDEQRLEEERRLCYVGITRARDTPVPVVRPLAHAPRQRGLQAAQPLPERDPGAVTRSTAVQPGGRLAASTAAVDAGARDRAAPAGRARRRASAGPHGQGGRPGRSRPATRCFTPSSARASCWAWSRAGSSASSSPTSASRSDCCSITRRSSGSSSSIRARSAPAVRQRCSSAAVRITSRSPSQPCRCNRRCSTRSVHYDVLHDHVD